MIFFRLRYYHFIFMIIIPQFPSIQLRNLTYRNVRELDSYEQAPHFLRGRAPRVADLQRTAKCANDVQTACERSLCQFENQILSTFIFSPCFQSEARQFLTFNALDPRPRKK